VLLRGLLYIGGWALMTAAIMLPTVLPLLHRFERLAPARAHRLADRRLFAGVGGVRFRGSSLDTALHRIIRQSTSLAVNGWVAFLSWAAIETAVDTHSPSRSRGRSSGSRAARRGQLVR
jgi:predicted metal-binding membrane protein